MESEDIDRNRFVLDVTKTAFLRDGFSISRVGGSAADGANSPNSEKADMSKRASSRPSSGKVGVSGSGKKMSSTLEKSAEHCLTILHWTAQACPAV